MKEEKNNEQHAMVGVWNPNWIIKLAWDEDQIPTVRTDIHNSAHGKRQW